MNNDTSSNVGCIQLSSLLPIHLERAYDILYTGIFTDEEVSRRPAHVKIEKVKHVLAGYVTPVCSARRWYEFFQYLNDAARVQPSEPKANPGGILSPEEWLKEKHLQDNKTIGIGMIPIFSKEEAFSMLDEYADHVARRVARNVRHRACEIIIDHQTDMSPRGVTIINNVHDLNRDIMNIKIRDVYQAKDE